MKKLENRAIGLALIAILFGACKKSSDNSQTTSTPATVQPNIVCDGKGSGLYFPLVMNNSWSYSDGSANSFDYTITGQAIYNSLTYFKVESTLGGTIYLRYATNGDLFIYNSGTNSDVIFIPANPVNGQSWNYTLDLSATRRVISSAASLHTSTCSYTGCLKIQTFDSGGALHHTYFFKKGLGMISTDEIWAGYIVTNLTAVTLN